jgi:hypothetical protein
MSTGPARGWHRGADWSNERSIRDALRVNGDELLWSRGAFPIDSDDIRIESDPLPAVSDVVGDVSALSCDVRDS